MTEQLLLTEAEAAARLSLCARTLRKARQEGKLHYVLCGRAVRYTVADLESFVERLRKVEPACTRPKPTRQSATTRRSDGDVIVPFRQRNKRR